MRPSVVAAAILAVLPIFPDVRPARAGEEEEPPVLAKVRRVATRVEVRVQGKQTVREWGADPALAEKSTEFESLDWLCLGFDRGKERIAWKGADFEASWEKEIEGGKEKTRVAGSLSEDGRLLKSLRIDWDLKGPEEGQAARAEFALRDVPLDRIGSSSAVYRVRGKDAGKSVATCRAFAEVVEDEEARRRDLESMEWTEEAEVRVEFSRRDGEELGYAAEVLAESGRVVTVEFPGEHLHRRAGADPAKAREERSSDTLEWSMAPDLGEALTWQGGKVTGSWTWDAAGRRGKRTVEGTLSEDGRTLLALRVAWEQEWPDVRQTVREEFVLENLPLRSVGEESVTFAAEGAAARAALKACVFAQDFGDNAMEDMKTTSYASTDWEKPARLVVTFGKY